MVSCVCIAFNLVACPSLHSRRFCPQHNILWDDLTVKEHMDIYAELKGLDPATKQEEIQALIVAVGLGNKVDKRSKSLSGGMKRKLSLAIALMGDNTKVTRGRGIWGCSSGKAPMCTMLTCFVCTCVGGVAG